MTPESPEAKRYLEELARVTKGDSDAKASMYLIGEAVGLDRPAAGKLAEELIAQGLVEIKTLSGGIGITAQGLEATRAGAPESGRQPLSLGSGPILQTKGRQAVDAILAAIKKQVAALEPDYGRLQEIVIDIKTLEVQLLSDKPKIAVVREILRSLQQTLEEAGAGGLARELSAIVDVRA